MTLGPAHPSAQIRPVALSISSATEVLHEVVGSVPGKKYSSVVRVVHGPGSSPVWTSMVTFVSFGSANEAIGSFAEISLSTDCQTPPAADRESARAGIESELPVQAPVTRCWAFGSVGGAR